MEGGAARRQLYAVSERADRLGGRKLITDTLGYEGPQPSNAFPDANLNRRKSIDGPLYHTTDGGMSWSVVESNLIRFMQGTWKVQQLDFVDQEYGWT